MSQPVPPPRESRTALVLVDIQNDYFSDGRWPLSGAEAAARNAALALDAAREAADVVIHVRHEAPAAAPFFVAGSHGAAIHPAVAPRSGETVIVKRFPNAFRGTGLQAVLQAQGIARIVLAGSMSHMCIDATARAATDLGYAVTVLHDACATRDLTFAATTVPAAQVQAVCMAALVFLGADVISTAAHRARHIATPA
ncbi:MAG: cysteine hydrolase family protein [Solimonas sp.]